MSRGPGKVERAIIAAFNESPSGRFTVRQLAEHAYPGEALETKHVTAVNRALQKLAEQLGLTRSRVRLPGQFGWHHVWGRR